MKPTKNLPDSSPSTGPSSPIGAATPTFKHLVVPRDADKTEDTKVNQNRAKDWESTPPPINTDSRTSSPPDDPVISKSVLLLHYRTVCVYQDLFQKKFRWQ